MPIPPIIMLTYNFFPDIGGIEIAVQNYAQVLTAHGHEVHVIVPLKNGRLEKEYFQSIPIHRFPFDWDEALAALLQNQNSDKFRTKTVNAIQEILDEIGSPYIIHAHGEAIVAGGWLKAQNRGLKLIYTPHASPDGLKELFQTKYFGPLHFQPALERTDLIAYHLGNRITDLQKMGIDPLKIREIVNFIDPSLFNPEKYDKMSTRKSLGLPENAQVIFSPTRVDTAKGLIELVNALPQILVMCPNVYLYLAGDLADGFILNPSEVERKIQRKIKKILPTQSHRVNFTGAIPYYDMPRWYRAADLIVLISHDECLPMCLLEAMAMNKPIIATEVGGIPSLIDNQTSRLIPAPEGGRVSPNVIAHAIIQELTIDKKKNEPLKILRQRILTEFSPEVGYRTLYTIYSELV